MFKVGDCLQVFTNKETFWYLCEIPDVIFCLQIKKFPQDYDEWRYYKDAFELSGLPRYFMQQFSPIWSTKDNWSLHPNPISIL